MLRGERQDGCCHTLFSQLIIYSANCPSRTMNLIFDKQSSCCLSLSPGHLAYTVRIITITIKNILHTTSLKTTTVAKDIAEITFRAIL